MIIAMVVVTIPAFGRVVRGGVLAAKQELYVEAARSSRLRPLAGRSPPHPAQYSGTGRGLCDLANRAQRHPRRQPQLSRPRAAAADPGLGSDAFSSGRTALAVAPHVATIPGLAIVLLAIAFNLMGDGVRDLLDPRLKRRTA